MIFTMKLIFAFHSCRRAMKFLLPAVFLLLCQTIEELECKELPAAPVDPPDIMNRTDKYGHPTDFRCYRYALKDFDDFKGDGYDDIRYTIEITRTTHKIGCTLSQGKIKYPPLTGLDPMMPFYIKKLHKGFFITTGNSALLVRKTPLQRMKEYCASMRVIAPAFLEYWERFHSESDVCEKIVVIIRNCYVYRQIGDMFATKLSERLCLDEDGCYNAMEYYEEDLPFCVKYTAISQFRNSSVGSWHHSVINYCKLTGMVPVINDTKYDMKILTQKGRTRDNLREMCLYLRYRVLPEEGKEQDIPEEVYDDDALGTTDGYHTGASILIAMSWWSLIHIVIANLSYNS